ncbi:MAG: hypothetical protein H6590_06035 [Flavobacteriales bacterium]|nr:hypothetical protein [Flavobacteriales bacterium]
MATARRPRLTPVAQPTDPFVQPGVARPGPALGGFNFDALRGLSQTLDSYMQGVERRTAQLQESQKEQAAQLAEENAAAITNAPEKSRLAVLNLDAKDNKATIEAFNAAGLKGADNPYAVLAAIKTAAVAQYRSLDYPGRLASAEFAQKNASTLFYKGPEAADAEVSQVREEVLKGLDLNSHYAREAILASMTIDEQAYRKDRLARRNGIYEQEREKTMAYAVDQPVDAALSAVFDETNGTAFSDSVEGLRAVFNQEVALTGDRNRAIDTMQRQLESALMDRVGSEGDQVVHAADMIQEQLNMPELSLWFSKLRINLQGQADRKESQDEKGLSKARATAHTQISSILAGLAKDGNLTWKQANEFIYQGQGNDIIRKVAEDTGVGFDQIATIREELLRTWGKTDRTENDDDLQSQTLLLLAQDKLPEARQLILGSNGRLSPPVLGDLISRLQSAEQRASSDTGVNSVANRNFSSFWNGLGQLPPEAQRYEGQIQAAYRQAFKAAIDENPNDLAAADIAGQTAALATSQMAEVKTAQTQMSPLVVVNDSSFQSTVVAPALRMMDARMESAAIAAGRQNPTDAELRRRNQVETRFRQRLEQEAAALATDPEILKIPTQTGRNVAIRSKLQAKAVDLLDQVEGLNPQTEKTLNTAQLNSATRLEHYEAVRITPSEVALMTPAGTDKGYFTFTNGAFTDTNEYINSYLTSLIATPEGSSISGLDGYRGRAMMLLAGPDLVLAMSARVLKGFPYPRTRAEAGDSKVGDLVLGAGSYTDALNTLRGIHTAIGLTPQEVINGKTRAGVPLETLFGRADGTPWTDLISPKDIPFFPTLKATEAAQEKIQDETSEPYRLMVALGLDPTDTKTVNTFFEWQISLQKRRKLDDSNNFKNDLEQLSRDYFRNLPPPSEDDPRWLRDLKKQARKKE